MKSLLSGLLLTGILAVAHAAELPPAPLSVFLDKHCLECHDSEVKKANLDLTELSFELSEVEQMLLWQRIFERVEAGEMPPAKKPQPEAKEAAQFLATLKKPLIQADAADMAARGRVRGRRLTRVEYEHTLQDLLGIDRPLKELLPEDRATHGFETVAQGQSLSHHQLGSYLDVADQALDEAFERALKGDQRYAQKHSPKDLARFTRGNYRGPDLRQGESISWPITLQFFGRMKVTEVPADGWYRITLKSVRAINPGADGAVWGTLRSGVCYSNAPLLFMVGLVEATPTPRDLVFEAWMQKDHMLELKPNDATLKRAKTGANGGNVSFEGRNLEKDGFAGIAHRGIEVQRVYPVADSAGVRHRLFGSVDLQAAEKAPQPALEQCVARFAKRAFRRPVPASQLAAYQDIGRRELKDGKSLTEALRASYRAILCSPRFLTFVEAPGALDDHALASRLSYALWVSMPDETLMRLADEKRLHEPEELTKQIRRMMADAKFHRFIRHFSDQWLKLKQIDFTSPDVRQFPTFDSVVQESMVQETRAYLTDLFQHDRSVTHLIDSDFTYLNSRLARHYRMKVDLKAGEGLQKVALSPAEAHRGGLLGQGAVLKVTADGTSTSPVVRGVFVNERLLGAHIPPPPPGVPAIEPDIRGATSIRDQLEKHRQNSSCASCHQTIDPPGFALENYDPVGVWRTAYGQGNRGAKVNPSGITPDGEAFADLIAWKQVYTQRRESLAGAFVEQFLTYATGAAPRFSDAEAIATAVSQAAKADYGLSTLIQASLQSSVFLTK